jgi:putative ABC transport system permease protein
LRAGRGPTTTSEAAVTDGVAAMLSVAIGDTIDLDGTARRVVGLVENPNDLDDEFVLLPPSELPNSQEVSMLIDASEPQLRQFGDQVGAIRLGGRSEVAEDVLAGVLMLLASTVVLLLVALIASASFTVIAQRRMPQYGMLSAIGGSERHIRLTVLASGALTGIIAAVIGVIVGIGGWLAISASMESLVGHRIDPANVPWPLVIAGMLLAIVAATGAAWWPARTMSRIPTVVALSGRTPQRTRSHRSALVALVLAAAGIACLRVGSDFGDRGPDTLQAILLTVGTLAVLAGVLFLCPVMIRAMGSAATTLPLSARLALRDLGRHQARSSAALAAIGLALGIPSVIVASVAAGENASPLGNLASDQILVYALEVDGPFAPSSTRIDEVQSGVDELVAALAESSVVRLDTFLDPSTPPEPRSGESLTYSIARKVSDGWTHVGTVYAATPELLAALGLDAADIAGGEVVTSATGALYVFGVEGKVDPRRREGDALTSSGTLPATYTSLPKALLDPAQAEQRGLNVVPSGLWLIQSDHALDTAEIDTARTVAARNGFRIETREDRSNLRMIRLAAGLAGSLLALGVLAATLGLIRGESANDMRTMTATGARRSTRRGIAAITAGALAGAGALLGIASAYIGLIAARVEHLTPIPWEDLAIIAVGTPMLATLAAWILAGREPPTIARRPLD